MTESREQDLENTVISFVPKKCPTCDKLCAVRRLGVWGYYCVECMMWWGAYDPWPKVETTEPGPEPEALLPQEEQAEA